MNFKCSVNYEQRDGVLKGNRLGSKVHVLSLSRRQILLSSHNYFLVGILEQSGINAVFYFSTAVFRNAGVPSDLVNVFVGIASYSGSIIVIILMDRLGRMLLLWSLFVQMSYFLQCGRCCGT